MNYTEITDYNKACEAIKENPATLPDVSMLSKEEGDDVINSFMLKRVFRALNTDPETGKVWEPNWNDTNQTKYSPLVEVEASEDKPGGFGFSYSCYDRWIAGAGSRLCTDKSEKIFHLFKHFGDLMLKCYLILR